MKAESRATDLSSREHQVLERLESTLLEGLLLAELLVVHKTPIGFEVGVFAEGDIRSVLRLAMRHKEVVGEPIIHVESKARMELLHLLIVSKWMITRHMI